MVVTSEPIRISAAPASRDRRSDPLPSLQRVGHPSGTPRAAERGTGTTATAAKYLLALASLALLVVAVGCAGSATAPSSYSAYSQTDTVVGTGTVAAAGLTATIDYTGWIYDPSKTDHRGAQFDSSIGKTPFAFVLGANSVIKGWEQGVPGMMVGGERVLVIPPSLAYGDTRNGPIPPNATLIFQLDLLDVQ